MSQTVLDRKISESKASSQQALQKMTNVREKLESIRLGATDPSAIIDIENATLEEVHKHSEVMNGNIAELIMGLEDVTNSFSGDFKQIQNETGVEKFIGIFARGKADSMRQERIRNSSIDDKLTDLISKSGTISEMLKGQLEVLRTEITSVTGNLEYTLAERERVIVDLESVRAQILALDPVIAKIQMQLDATVDNVTRTQLETELANQNAQFNALDQREKVLTSESQTLERYVEYGKTWLDSLQNQEGAQIVLISKLDIDTKQRVVLYNALVKSLKTAQQQDVAHKINEIGVETDKQGQVAMAAIASASNKRLVEMLEKHEGDMVFTKEVMAQKERADASFNRRFSEIARKHDSALYGEQ